MTWRAGVVTLLPEAFPGSLGLSMAGRALQAGIWSLDCTDIRAFGTGRHRTVDEVPFGGGPGMVLKPDVLAAAIDTACPEGDDRPRLLLTPRGRPATQARMRALAAGPGVVLVCGRFEGADERIVAARGLEEIAVGDVVLSGGEPAALMLLDACVRLLPGVMGDAESGIDESFEQDLLEYPHYTRPAEWQGMAVPEVLTSGDHGAIARWRRLAALRVTRLRRPDLWAKYVATCVRGVDKRSDFT
jgi:tRNA (guanine37-N1)-methyltransferase